MADNPRKKFDPTMLTEYLEEYNKNYLYELACLQVELVSLQKHISETGQKLLIIFEGRDAAGKGSAIQRFTQHLNPRHINVVALPKPNEIEKGQWYFQRYMKHLPDAGKIHFFDRSWYNRAVVEPAMGFCTPQQHEKFLTQVNSVEKLLIEDGIKIIKFWFSISYDVQEKRISERVVNPLKNWKLSPIDKVALAKWSEFTEYKNKMFKRTNSRHCPWIIVRGNDKRLARVESIRYVLSQYDYPDKGLTGQRVDPDPTIISKNDMAPVEEKYLGAEHPAT